MLGVQEKKKKKKGLPGRRSRHGSIYPALPNLLHLEELPSHIELVSHARTPEASGNRGFTSAANQSVRRMKYPALVAVAFLQELLFLGTVPFTYSQRTNARQGIGRDPPTIKIPGQGTIVGRDILLARPQKVTVYLGVPYAQPPLGQLRFAAPVTDPLPSWSGVRNASQFAPSCQQVSNLQKLHEKLYRRLLPPDLQDPGVSEDCLYLNLYVPDGSPPPGGWPVIVWFHGGDFNTGTPAIWDATVFVNKQKVLVVTVAYRLNILGFFTTTDAEASGNYGMLDQVAALDWIKNNINLFEGSPSNVVIAGHSSGAISVGLHMVSPLSKGKFAKAIAMSGDAIGSVRTPDLEVPVVDDIANRFGCFRRPTSALMACLRRVNATLLVQETSNIETWGPIVDADTNNSTMPFLPAHPKYILETGDFSAVPLMAGYVNNEQALYYIEMMGSENDGKMSLSKFESMITDDATAAVEQPSDNSTSCESRPSMVAEAVLFFYRPHPPSADEGALRDRYLDLQTEKNYAAGLALLAGKVSKQEQAFVYRFDYRPRTLAVSRDVPEWAGVPHMFELPFVWGLPHSFTSAILWQASDKKLADVMMMMIANFVRIGSPSLNNVRWEPFTEDRPGILIIDRTINMSDLNSVDFRALAFWNDYYPRLVTEATNICCNATATGTSSRIVGSVKLCVATSLLAVGVLQSVHV